MKEKDLSNLSHENEVNENLDAKDNVIDSHEKESVEKESPDAEIESEKNVLEVDQEEVVAEATIESPTDNLEEKPNVEAAPVAEVKEEETELQKEPDYSLMEKKELVDRLVLLLDNKSVKGIKDRLDAIKHNFYKKHNEEIAEAKKKFLDEGGKEEEFDFGKDELESKMKELLHDFRERRTVQNRNIEQEKDENLKIKYQIIEDIKDLVNRKEAFDKTFHEFRALQKRWHETGMVPQQALKNLWDNYHHHVENFYDYIKINKELRDLDLKKNMVIKVKLCEEAEGLLNEESVVKAFNTLQKYHEQWREIGPVPREQKEELWARFKEATTTINRKHQEFYEGLKSEQKVNLEKKSVLCDKAEVIANAEIKSHKEWNETSKNILDLQKEWRTIGFAPKKDNNRIYQRFRAACDLYFDRKREFYLKLKDKLGENLVKKTELCEVAESLQDSTDWKATTEKLITIQKQWKTIGPVPRKVSEELWVRFRAACDKFFNSKSEHFNHVDSDHVENLKLKEDLIKKISEFTLSEDDEGNMTKIRDFQKQWAQIGHVPFKKKDKIQDEYRRTLNAIYDKMDLDTEDKEVQKFQSKIDNLLTMSHSEDKIIVERNKIAGKIKQLESDIGLWENNIGFFSASKTSGSIVQEIEEKIEKGKQTLQLLQEKLKVIDGLV
ncbi:DUF349 domain-containing protein [Labilibaculum sp. DW002]|jgi:uncharacterized protein DUF349|uniref:DUF349 domain-containing protein n=1 Tax=Paralabilibaculum antarcticum TaxID=2912572 RepID=A0ABT5VPV6_9BACT|nr:MULTISPECIES: DUF349 domain-containing protein [unclassified Labilibaculum]MBI9057162.1 DUF349 domain-containing protein [Labilibaculum sp.]MDE5417471.1 DUF349 domain-containing protein [Labilibaculum sp. DW002]|eukprot:TRINITY_DN493_c0_g1_i1.p1 TRINITY_DN493_c0_g1~~TRINITY_DN493_c0_g1_i1.p1  ORF type:complete len:666 (+),score=154.44 TRINITY_DN493_c0_g1_i1:813-2810(+)